MPSKRVAQDLRVLNEHGQPCAGVSIAVIVAEGPTPEIAYLTDEEGGVRIGLPPGKATLEAFLPGGGRERFSIDASADPGVRQELRLKGSKA
jgi:hypothetical protein